MRTITTRSSGQKTAQSARARRYYSLLHFARARWLELSSQAERAKAIAQRRSPATERRRQIADFRTFSH
jgi:hypothetical protein